MNASHTLPQTGIQSTMDSNNSNNSRQVDIPLGPLDDNRKFFLANMAYHFTALDAKQWFGRFGTVNHVKIIYDKTGQSKGYGFLYMHTAEGAAAVDAFAESQNFKINMLGRSNVHCARHDQGRVKPQYNNNNHRQHSKKRSYSNNSHSNPKTNSTTTNNTPTSLYGGVNTNVANNLPAKNSANSYATYSTSTNNGLQPIGTVPYTSQNSIASTALASYSTVTPQPPQQQQQQQQQQPYQPHHVAAAPTSTLATTIYHQPQQPPLYNTNQQLPHQPSSFDPNNNNIGSNSVNVGASYEPVAQPQQQQQHYAPPPPPPPQQQQVQPQYSYNNNVPTTSYQQQTQPVTTAYTQPPTYAPPKNIYNDPALQQTSYNSNNNMGNVYNSNVQTVVPQQTTVSKIPPPPPPPPTKILLSNLPPTVQPSDVVSWLMTDINTTVSRCTLEYIYLSNTSLAHLTVPKGSNNILELSRKNQLLFKNQIVYATTDANPPSDGRAIPIGMGAPVTSSTPTIKPSQNHYRGGKGRGGRGGGGHNRGHNSNRNRHHQPY